MSKKHTATKPASSITTTHRKHKDRKQNPIWLWSVLGMVVVAAVAFLLLRPGNTLPAEVSVAQAYGMYEKGAFFLDVRTQEEWNQVHLANSTLIPLDELPNRLNELPKDKDIVVICGTGHRSKEGASILSEAGFTRVTCMSGGLQAWNAAGYPAEWSIP